MSFLRFRLLLITRVSLRVFIWFPWSSTRSRSHCELMAQVPMGTLAIRPHQNQNFYQRYRHLDRLWWFCAREFGFSWLDVIQTLRWCKWWYWGYHVHVWGCWFGLGCNCGATIEKYTDVRIWTPWIAFKFNCSAAVRKFIDYIIPWQYNCVCICYIGVHCFLIYMILHLRQMELQAWSLQFNIFHPIMMICAESSPRHNQVRSQMQFPSICSN